ncbi:hypothetical protein LNV47_25295, partial [Paucibacter sp. DJ4R-1]|nr:hypothetical protein [Paucibacter sp. DJ4R-1]
QTQQIYNTLSRSSETPHAQEHDSTQRLRLLNSINALRSRLAGDIARRIGGEAPSTGMNAGLDGVTAG